MILAFTGAGISKASGIPTFDEQPGIRDILERDYATRHSGKYLAFINDFKKRCDECIPNDAHRALSEYNVPVITMNVDTLHQQAGTQHLLPIHGTLPDIVLYGDPAPNYQVAHDWVGQLREDDIFLIIGTSFYTIISIQLKILALSLGADVILIDNDAEHEVRKTLELYRNCLGDFDEFINREIE